jgi:hypothetical protein
LDGEALVGHELRRRIRSDGRGGNVVVDAEPAFGKAR